MSPVNIIKRSIIVLVIAIISSYVFVKAWPVDDVVHRQTIDSFIELENNQLAIQQIVLKVSLNQNYNFDNLMYLQKRQLDLANYLSIKISTTLDSRTESTTSKLEQYRQSQDYTSELISNFIRSSAVLKNSTNYFIYLGNDFLHYLDDTGSSINDSNTIKSIIADTLITDISARNAMKISNPKNSVILSQIINDLDISTESNYIFLPKHLDKITKHAMLMDNEKIEILSNDITEIIRVTFSTYLNEYEELTNNKSILADLATLIITSLTIFIVLYVFSLKKTKGDLLEEVNKLSTAMEQSHDAVMILNLSKNIEYTNSTFTKITGYSFAEAFGKTPAFLRPNNSSDEPYVALWDVVSKGDTWTGELRKERKDGEFYWAFESLSPIFDAKNNMTHFLSTHRDITEQYLLNEQVAFDASHDALTGLVNRREFEQQAKRLLTSVTKQNEQHALCFMDLDQFKIVNDTCGHAAGDELLRQLGLALKRAMRKRDLLARLGGDEFGVLIEHCSLKNAHEIASILKQVIQDYQFTWQGRIFKVGVSIGLVAITERVPNLSELLKYADASCYIAKEMGRNRIHVYNENDTEIAQHQGQMQWVTRINKAIDEDLFCLYAQAIVSLNNSNDRHYELLIRMIGDNDDTIPPGAFLPAAERYNIIVNLDRWVVSHAFKVLLTHPGFLNKISFISINLSGQSLAEKEFLNFVLDEFQKTGILPEKICFEITETTAISNLDIATQFISKMKELGCQFALDDFGSGLASFAYLKNLPVDYLKIDGMFVKNMINDPIDHAMVRSINEIGHVMGVKTIAEFVENEETKIMLREIGIDYVQGYAIGKPQPFEELLKLT